MTVEEHILTTIMEECSEVAKACAKALRFGLETRSNNDHILSEYYDIKAMIKLAQEGGILSTYDKDEAARRIAQKKLQFNRSLIVAMRLGTLKQ